MIHWMLRCMFEEPICQQHWIILQVHFWDLYVALFTIWYEIEQVTGGSPALMRQQTLLLYKTQLKSVLSKNCGPLTGYVTWKPSVAADCPHHQNLICSSVGLLICVLWAVRVLQLKKSLYRAIRPPGIICSPIPPPSVSVAHFRPCSLKRLALSVRPCRDTCFIRDNCYFSSNVIAIVTLS